VLPADADLLDIATESFAYIFKDKGELDEMLFLGVTEGRQLFMLGLRTPSPELKIRVYDTMRRISKQLDVVTYAHACEVWYTTQKCVEGQQINIAAPSRDPQRTEALRVSVVAKDAQVRCVQADIVRDAQGQATLLPRSRSC
jgi:gamma-glutamyl:cysteine ligase YbdK (ATP-grasp superfamily)